MNFAGALLPFPNKFEEKLENGTETNVNLPYVDFSY